jgi:hypothetical protein
MSNPPFRDPGNPANPNSPLSPMNQTVLKTSSPTQADWILTGFVVGIFALGLLLRIIDQHFF